MGMSIRQEAEALSRKSNCAVLLIPVGQPLPKTDDADIVVDDRDLSLVVSEAKQEVGEFNREPPKEEDAILQELHDITGDAWSWVQHEGFVATAPTMRWTCYQTSDTFWKVRLRVNVTGLPTIEIPFYSTAVGPVLAVEGAWGIAERLVSALCLGLGGRYVGYKVLDSLNDVIDVLEEKISK